MGSLLLTRREELKDQAKIGSRIQDVSYHLCDSQRKSSQLARQRFGERLSIRRVALVHDIPSGRWRTALTGGVVRI
jgi:hypothetical protein